MATTAWILIVTLNAASPQFQEFTSKENCEAARIRLVQTYTEARRYGNQVYRVEKNDWVLLPGNAGEVRAAANTMCTPK